VKRLTQLVDILERSRADHEKLLIEYVKGGNVDTDYLSQELKHHSRILQEIYMARLQTLPTSI
jgi:ubiquinone biosynthesis protein UbiJ